MKNEIEEIKKGMAVYKKAQKRIIKLIKQHGGRLTDEAFDEEFAGRPVVLAKDGTKTIKLCPTFPLVSLSPNSFILGDMGGLDISKWIHLIQLMVAAKILKRRCNHKTEEVVYSLNKRTK